MIACSTDGDKNWKIFDVKLAEFLNHFILSYQCIILKI